MMERFLQVIKNFIIWADKVFIAEIVRKLIERFFLLIENFVELSQNDFNDRDHANIAPDGVVSTQKSDIDKGI